jgi:hypothetical protein
LHIRYFRNRLNRLSVHAYYFRIVHNKNSCPITAKETNPSLRERLPVLPVGEGYAV